MTVVLARRRAQQKKVLKSRLRALDESVWKSIKGMWKDKVVDPVAYQRKLRQEADAEIV